MNAQEKITAAKVKAITAAFANTLEWLITEGVIAYQAEGKPAKAAKLTGGGPLAYAKAVAKPAAKPVAKAAAKPVTKAAAKPVTKPAPTALGGERFALYEFVKGNPGARSEEMPGFAGKASLLKELLESGYLRRTGAARGTRYFTKKQLKAA
jgi:hypothetical protein